MADSEVKLIISADGKNAVKVSQEISSAYKTLAATSIAEINRKKAEVITAYETIKRSGVASAQEIAQAERAKNAAIKRANGELLGDQTTLISKLKNSWLELTAAIGMAYGAIRIGKESIDAALTMERINISMQAVTNNSTLAGREIQYLREESKKLGLDFSSTAQEYIKFAAAAKNTSIEGETTRKIFMGVSEAVAALKLNAQDASLIYMAMTQMISKGRVSMEELRQQMGERLPGAIRLAAEGMGMSTAELNKHIEKGEIMAQDLLPKLAEQLHKTYGQAAIEAATSGQAEINRFNNALFETKAALGDSLMPVFTDVLNFLRGALPYVQAFVGGIKMMTAELAGFIDKMNLKMSQFGSPISYGFNALFNTDKYQNYKKAAAQIDKTIDATKADIYKKLNPDVSSKKSMLELSEEQKKVAAARRKEEEEAKNNKKTGGVDKYANALRQITTETTAWANRIAEMNPELEKQDNEILKLTHNAETLIEKIKQAGKAGGVDVTKAIADVRAGLEQGKLYITAKLEKEKAQKELKEREKLAEEYRKMASEESQFAQTENERAINKIIHQEQEKLRKLEEMHQKAAITKEEYQKTRTDIMQNAAAARLEIETQTAKRIADINYNLIQGIAGMQTWAHELRLQQIEAQAAAYLKDGADPRAVEAWKQDQALRANITKGIKGGDFAAGYKAQLEQYKLDMKTAGEYGAEVFKAQGDAIKESFGSVFRDLREGELKDFSEYFKTFADKLLSKWEDMLSEMLTNWILTGSSMQSSGPGTSSESGGGFMGMMGGLFGSWGGGGSEGSGILGFISSLFHEGGVPKYDSVMTRVVDPAIFLTAPRFHGGIGPGERPAIIKDDEGVFTPGQMKALGAGMTGNTYQTSVTVHVDDPRLAGRLRAAVEDAVQKELQRVS